MFCVNEALQPYKGVFTVRNCDCDDANKWAPVSSTAQYIKGNSRESNQSSFSEINLPNFAKMLTSYTNYFKLSLKYSKYRFKTS